MIGHFNKNKFSVSEIPNSESAALEGVQTKKKRKLFKKIFIFLAVVALATAISGSYLFYKTNSTFDEVTGQQNSLLKSILKMLPLGGNFFQVLPVEGGAGIMDKIKNNKLERLNILLLGIRGVGDPNGGLLTDTLMVISIRPKTGEIALISIPRDLYVEMPYGDKKSKINEAYELGIKSGRWKKGLEYSKKVVSDVMGLDIHYAVSVDFRAFKEIIDTLGGVAITLDKPFAEKNQFEEGEISLPAGRQTIDGDAALLFVRARFSSSDFDRARRQQQVLLAMKEKALSLGVLSNPMKIIAILNSIGEHVKTDAELWEIQELAVMAQKLDASHVKRRVFETGEEGLLYSARDSGDAFILLPKGDNFDKIREASANIFD